MLLVTGCSAAAAPRASVPCLIETTGDEARLTAAIAEASVALPLDVTVIPRPTAPSAEPRAAFDFASLRTAYDEGDLETCVATAPDDVAIVAWLREHARTEASRALFWRMACLRALGRIPEAERAAAEHAARGLPLPADLGAGNAIAETLLRDAHRHVAALEPVALAVEVQPAGAALEIDGLPRPERAPATLTLPPGPHLVRVSSPTFAPHEVAVELLAGEPTRMEVTLSRAEPEVALAEAAVRHDATGTLDEDVTLSLLAVAVRTRALVLVTHDADRTRAALVTLADEAARGTIVRAGRVGADQWDLRALLSDVLVRGELMARPREIYELPELWVAVGAAILVGVGVTLVATWPPDIRTRVTW